MKSGVKPVKIGNRKPREVEFSNTAHTLGGIEVLTLAKLQDKAPPGEFLDPQRPNFSLLLFITEGSLNNSADFRTHHLTPGSLLLVHPGQLLLWGDLTAAKGHCVLFRPDALSAQLSAFLPMPYENNHWKLSPAMAAAFEAQFSLLESCTTAPRSDQIRAALLQHQLAAILLHLSLSSQQPQHGDSPGYQHHREFKALLEASFSRQREVSWYAQELGLSVRTLRNACTQSENASPKQIIDSRVVLEAKRFLIHSEVSISALAELLNFRDSSNFSNFFKQSEGMSPREFRNRQRLVGLLGREAVGTQAALPHSLSGLRPSPAANTP